MFYIFSFSLLFTLLFPLLPFFFSFLLLLFPHLHHHFLLRASTLSSCFAHALLLPTYSIHHSTYSLLCQPIGYSIFHFACSPLYLFIMFCMLATFCLLVILPIHDIFPTCHILPSHHVLIFLLNTLTCLTIKLLFAFFFFKHPLFQTIHQC